MDKFEEYLKQRIEDLIFVINIAENKQQRSAKHYREKLFIIEEIYDEYKKSK